MHDLPGVRMSQEEGAGITVRLDLTQADWNRAISLYEPVYQSRVVGWKRRREIQSEIAALCESGKVVSAYRGYYGGELVTVPRDWWRTEHTDSRFSIGRILPRSPFQEAPDIQEAAWLFLNRSQFEEHISPASGEEPVTESEAQSLQVDEKAIALAQWPQGDEPHFRAMKELIKKGEAMTPADAARMRVKAGGVGGSGTDESKAKRLARKYPLWNQHQAGE